MSELQNSIISVVNITYRIYQCLKLANLFTGLEGKSFVSFMGPVRYPQVLLSDPMVLGTKLIAVALSQWDL